jgi:hypothetical protein
MRRPFAALLLLTVPSLAAAQQPCGLPGVTFDVPASVPQGQPVVVTLTNGSAQTIQLPTSCVFESVSSGSTCGAPAVFTPLCLFILTPIAPGQSASGTWFQQDNGGAQVPPGSYSIRVRYWDAGFTSLSECCAPVTVTSACAPASASVRNGSGINPLTLASVQPPHLGGTWDTSLDCSAHAPGSAFRLAFDAAAAGPLTPFGEVLVGGTRLLRLVQPHASTSVTFSVAVPPDISLCGRQAYAQGACFGAPGPRLGNALDLVLGS